MRVKHITVYFSLISSFVSDLETEMLSRLCEHDGVSVLGSNGIFIFPAEEEVRDFMKIP